MKKIIKIFICISLIYTPFFAFAGAAEAWTIEEVVYNDIGKNLSYTASKTGAAANDYIYKAKVPVTAAATGSTVAAMIRMGLAGAAIYGIVEGVGWIIENGVVKKQEGEEENVAPFEYVWAVNTGTVYISPTAEGLCKKAIGTSTSSYSYSRVVLIDLNTADCYWIDKTGSLTGVIGKEFKNFTFYRVPNKQYDPTFKPVYVPVPDSELGKAINDSSAAPELLPDIYSPNNPAGGAAPKSTTDALDSANPIPRSAPTSDTKKNPNKDTNNDGKPDVYDPTQPDQGESTVWPEACNWFPAACEFFKVQKQDNKEIKDNQKEQIAQDKTFFDSVEEWFDWTKDDTDLPDDEKPEIQDLPVPELKEDAIRWSAQCPADAQVPINMQGVSSTITFSWSPWCQLLDMIKPAIIASAYIGAAFIVLGLRT